MADQERDNDRQRPEEMDPKYYYDYEGLIIKERLEREHMYLLPRVVKPPMFAKGGHALGDLRVFERYTVGPLSSLTCSFVDLEPGARTDRQRMIPSLVGYVLEGSGECVQEGKRFRLTPEDVIVIPPYTTYQFVADPESRFRVWQPEVRLWHLLGLLWQEQSEFRSVPDGAEAVRDAEGQLLGFRIRQGVLGLKSDLEVGARAEPKREGFFHGRRAVSQAQAGNTKYHYFLRRLVEENKLEEKGPRVIRGAERPWEETRQGRLKFYIGYWTELAAPALDLMVMEIRPGENTGKHRHIFEELVFVAKGNGYDVHEGTHHAWEAGDLICIPPMTIHQHFNDGKDVARLVSVWPRQLAHEFLGGIEHMSDSSSWKE